MRRAALSLVLVILGLSACGIPVDSAAHPFSYVAPAVSNPPSGGTKNLVIYFVRAGRLVAVNRPVLAPSPETALAYLALGPNTQEQAQNLVTAIEAPARVTLVGASDGVATVELDQPFIDLPEGFLAQAYGQIVYTLTSPGLVKPDIQAVKFVIGSRNVPWPLVILANGANQPSGQVGRKDYCSIAPPPGCSNS